ncbi:electron transporter [Erythrobacter sp. HI0019]|uniref:SCO family protein n=1 Tax=unclassified Erythrobacter TaxID=2633097 RepID=UPI0007B8D5CA|nr:MULTISPECIES: SCO family protein [unclassified Erythrobacter]KZX91490.1 electron transporter [Erythrobacter sp. HI0019]KZY10142.1 electron transporter [Erythrobacter sp. HI0028]
MNRDTMLRNSAPLVAALLALAACQDAPPEQSPLAGAAIGAEFTLTGEDGDPVSWSDFDGQYRTLYFGYTYCPDVCPVDTQRAMAGLKAFEQANPELGAQIQPLFVSVDPARDTPAVLAEFTDSFHPRLIGMTGTKEQIDAVTEAFAAVYSIEEPNEAGGYLVGHTNITYLFGPDGEPLAMLPTDQGPEAVAAELDKWVR